jgi:DNA modification methylase
MAGSGTTIDACLLMNRRCKGYDINPTRQDIIKHSTLHDFPDKKANLVFLDPPYWTMKSDDYAFDSISALSLDEFYGAIASILENVYSALKDGGYLAFIIQNQTEKDIPEGLYYLDHVFECMKIMETRFKFVRRIAAPQSTQTFLPQQEIKAKQERRMLGVVRDLVIAKK